MTDSARIPEELAARIRLVVVDVDGVLTDGGIYVMTDARGRPGDLRRFHVLDGMAAHLLRRAGLHLAAVSGKQSTAVRARMEELGIDESHQVHPFRKVAAVERILEARGLTWAEVACLADDLADVAVMEKAALPAAVANAVPEIRARAAWRGSVPGGQGALREFVEALLRARGVWEEVVEEYVRGCREGEAREER